VTDRQPAIGVLYPGYGCEQDYRDLLAAVGGFEARVVNVPLADAADTDEAIRAGGDPQMLAVEAAPLVGCRSVVWACTSGSFVGGARFAEAQRRALERATGAPATSTSLAFVQACRAFGYRRVAVAATYPAWMAERFVGFLQELGIEVAAMAAMELWLPSAAAPVSAEEFGMVPEAAVRALIERVDGPDLDAILVPDTALFYTDWAAALSREGTCPRLFANPVSVWAALSLAGWRGQSAALAPLGCGAAIA
jgi:maleate cis-trans isomerase